MSDVSLTWFLESLSQIKAANQELFDPVRLAYFESLSHRLREPRHSKNQTLISSACDSLRQYLSDYEIQKKAAKDTVDWVASDFPDHIDLAQQAYEACEFATLERLKQSLQNAHNSVDAQVGLSELVNSINHGDVDVTEGQALSSLDDLLTEQEATTLEQARVASGSESMVANDGRGEQLELQSMKVFRHSMKYFDIDQLISRAINECPENPGPHNPQMLAVKALMQMRDLSPQYLRRFAGYIEAMLWLEKNSAKLTTIKGSG